MLAIYSIFIFVLLWLASKVREWAVGDALFSYAL
jgi:hypothetical protein